MGIRRTDGQAGRRALVTDGGWSGTSRCAVGCNVGQPSQCWTVEREARGGMEAGRGGGGCGGGGKPGREGWLLQDCQSEMGAGAGMRRAESSWETASWERCRSGRPVERQAGQTGRQADRRAGRQAGQSVQCRRQAAAGSGATGRVWECRWEAGMLRKLGSCGCM